MADVAPTPPLFLLGGGDIEAAYVRTYWRFIEAATVLGERRIAIVAAADSATDRAAIASELQAPFLLFASVDAAQLPVLWVTRDEPLNTERLRALHPTGVYLAGHGGMAACLPAMGVVTDWLAHVQAKALPCAGSGAGAALLGRQVIAGGWLLALLHSNAEVAAQACGDGLDFVELQPGLALAPFALDVQAVQRGTLGRLIHVVGQGMLPCAWGLDEGCMLEIGGDQLRVCGPNHAYRVLRLADGAVRIDTFAAGTFLPRARWTAEVV
jgi:cyanophycinase-like exopeptidase